MIVDTSALVAIVRAEPDAAVYAESLAAADGAYISAANFVVDASRDPVATRRFDQLMHAGISIAPVTAEQARMAREAYRDFGKGSGHPARLNFGDCLSYAPAKERSEPLLFKGTDFPHTDLASALR